MVEYHLFHGARPGHFYRHRVTLYFFSLPPPLPTICPSFLQYHFYTAVFKKTPSNIADTRYSPAGSNSVFSWKKKKKRKIVTYRNQRESNSVERDDLDRNATRTMSLQDEIPVRIRMGPFGTIISRPCGFVIIRLETPSARSIGRNLNLLYSYDLPAWSIRQ